MILALRLVVQYWLKYIEVIEGIGKIEVFFTSLGFHGMSFLDFVALKFVQEIHSNAKIQWSRRSPKKQKEICPPVLFFGEGCITDT